MSNLEWLVLHGGVVGRDMVLGMVEEKEETDTAMPWCEAVHGDDCPDHGDCGICRRAWLETGHPEGSAERENRFAGVERALRSAQEMLDSAAMRSGFAFDADNCAVRVEGGRVVDFDRADEACTEDDLENIGNGFDAIEHVLVTLSACGWTAEKGRSDGMWQVVAKEGGAPC